MQYTIDCLNCGAEMEIELDESDYITWCTTRCKKCKTEFKVMVTVKLEKMK